MPIPNRETIKTITSPDWLGATRRVYSNYLASSTDVIAADFFEDDSFNFAARDLMWARLSDGYFTFRFINTTTVEVATD